MQKGLLYKIHKWTGISLALLFLLQGLTGSLITFREEVTSIVTGAGNEAAAISHAQLTDSIVSWVDTNYPNFQINRIQFYDSVALARLQREGSDWPEMAMFDRRSGEFLRSGPLHTFPLELAARLHYSLVAGLVGSLVIGLEGLFLAAMSITGIILWWPKPGRWKRSLKVPLRARGLPLWYQLHKVVGAWMMVVLFIIGSTGALLIFEDQLKALVSKFTPIAELAMPALPDSEKVPSRLGYDQAFSLLYNEFPGEHIRQVRFMGPNNRAVIFIVHNELGINSHGYNFAVADRSTDALAAVFSADSVPAAEKFFQLLLPIHNGQLGGPVLRLVSLFGGLTLLLMVYSGIYVWWKRRRDGLAKGG